MILGIDYGLKNIGLAISAGQIAEPLPPVKVQTLASAITAIACQVRTLEVKTVVVGISEGQSKMRTLAFAKKLQNVLRLPVEYVDETLSTYEANRGWEKEKSKQHSRAAAIILQRYLDSTNKQNV